MKNLFSLEITTISVSRDKRYKWVRYLLCGTLQEIVQDTLSKHIMACGRQPCREFMKALPS